MTFRMTLRVPTYPSALVAAVAVCVVAVLFFAVSVVIFVLVGKLDIFY